MRVSDLIEKLQDYDENYEVHAVETGGIRIADGTVEQIEIPFEDAEDWDNDEE